MASQLWPLQMFDPAAEVAVVERKLPHWMQAGTVCFITWRTFDSLPAAVLCRWHVEREEWLRKYGIEPGANDWQDQLHRLSHPLRAEFTKTFSERWHRGLDDGHGDCILREPSHAKIVADSLLHFDGERYEMTDFVVMPNHVHLLAAFVDEGGMLELCDSWKHFTARELNRARPDRSVLAARRLRSLGSLSAAFRCVSPVYRGQSEEGGFEGRRIPALFESSGVANLSRSERAT